jgi:hypothetical protein
MAGKIDLRELPPELRDALKRKLGKRSRTMTMHEVRSYSLRVLAVMADLQQSQRARILRHALRVNEV